MAQDKEKIKDLTRKINDLELALKMRGDGNDNAQGVDRVYDDKLKSLNAIHAEKVRSLMNSIQLLKKENASLGKGQKEHKRSEHIQQLNKEIGDQDIVIDVLRGMIPDQKKADAAVIQRLSKGPERIRVLTREELKMEIKELKAKLLKYEKKKGQGATMQMEDDAETMNNDSVMTGKGADLGGKLNNGNADLIMKINDLNNEIEDLNLMVSGKQTEVDKYKELISKKNQEIIELSQARVDLKFMLTKNEELKAEVDSLRSKLTSDLYNTYDAKVKMEVAEVAGAMHKNIESKNEETIKAEVGSAQAKLQDLTTQNKQLMLSNNKLKEDLAALRSLLENVRDKNQKLGSEHDGQMGKLNAQVKQKETQLKAANQKLEDYEKQFDSINVQLKNKQAQINDLEAKIEEAGQMEIVKSHRGATELDISQISQADAHAKELEEKKLELEQEMNHLMQENYRLREKVKELTKIEIELADQVDVLEQENRFLARKVIAQNLIVKETYNDYIPAGELKKEQKELAGRYEGKIKEMTKRIKELEARNKDLEDIERIMNTPKSQKSVNYMVDSMALE